MLWVFTEKKKRKEKRIFYDQHHEIEINNK